LTVPAKWVHEGDNPDILSISDYRIVEGGLTFNAVLSFPFSIVCFVLREVVWDRSRDRGTFFVISSVCRGTLGIFLDSSGILINFFVRIQNDIKASMASFLLGNFVSCGFLSLNVGRHGLL